MLSRAAIAGRARRAFLHNPKSLLILVAPEHV